MNEGYYRGMALSAALCFGLSWTLHLFQAPVGPILCASAGLTVLVFALVRVIKDMSW